MTARADAFDLAVVATNAPPAVGGIERLVDGLCRHVAPGRTVLVRPPAPGLDRLPYPVHAAPLVGWAPPRWRPAIRTLRTAPRTPVTLAAEWWPMARALPASRRPGRRVVLALGSDVAQVLADRRLARIAARALAAADTVVAISHHTAGLCRRLDVDATVIAPPVEPLAEPATGDDPLAPLGLADRPVVATVARLVARKGHRHLLDRWATVTAAHPDATWVVAGDGPELGRLRALAPPGVHVLGAVDDGTVTALLRRADLHVLPGVEVAGAVEGYGMAAVEAGLVGTPTLATDVDGVADAVGPGGVVVPAGDHDALVDEIVALLGDDRRRGALAAAATAHAAASSWDALAPRWRDVLGLPATEAVAP